MPSMRTYNRSFAGGEISPEMFGRIDDAKFQTGAAKMLNFVATPTGAANNRPGFAFVKATKNNGPARLLPFTYSLNQTMVIELGANYARFHTQGETLEYDPATLPAWIPPSGNLTYTLTSPAVITWNGHGLVTGNPIRFYVYGSSTPGDLPGGLQLGYTYTVQVIDANNFTLLDQNNNPVAFTPPADGGSVTYTDYAGAGVAAASLFLGPNQSGNAVSAVLGGLANIPVPGGVAQLNVTFTVATYNFQGGGAATVQYSTDGLTWHDAFALNLTRANQALSTLIPLANLNLLQLRVEVSGGSGPSGSFSMSGTINAWSAGVPTSGGSSGPPLRAYYYYTAGDAVTYGGNPYVSAMADSGGETVPGTNAAIWYELPADGTYEIPTPYAAADLFGIHYTQSADVMTLVHPNYPPAELSRLGAMNWQLSPIDFGPPLATPQNVAAVASPGFLAQISTITDGTGTQAGQALITTKSNHTLALGDGVYVANLTFTPTGGQPQVLDGFYMVDLVPADGSGNLIPNELYLSDYSGNELMFQSGGAYSADATIQYGDKIFNITNPYAVQAIGSDGVSASALSASASILNNLDVPGSYNTISWEAVPNASTYNVYKQFNGLWGFIGNTQATSFVDNNIAPDMSIVPGTPDAVFTSPGNYPGAVCYYQQRRCFAGSTNGPDNAWMSNSGTESMFTYSLPSLATDRIAFRVAATKADVILHLVPMMQLLMLTSETEYALVPVTSDVITPSTIDVKPQSYIGASIVQPTIINTQMVYAAARGGHVRELGYAWTVNGFMTGDLSLRAAHLFDTFTIVDQAYSKSPWPIIWFVSSNGSLLGLTYIPEEQLGAWHEHTTTNGSFESICCVAEGAEDVLYAVVNRTIGGQTVRYLERMASRIIDEDDSSTWFFVDSGISQAFENPVTQVTGLTWLEGQTVAVLADGCVQTEKVVTNGAITLDHAASQVAIGLPYTCDLQTLPAVLQLDGYGQGRMKNINKAWLKVFQSSGILVGPDENDLTEIKQRTTEPFGSPPALQTNELFILTTPSWQTSGQALIRQQNPLPLTVVGLTLEVAIGG